MIRRHLSNHLFCRNFFCQINLLMATSLRMNNYMGCACICDDGKNGTHLFSGLCLDSSLVEKEPIRRDLKC